MDVVADVGALRDNVNHLVVHILGMRSHEADAMFARILCKILEQFCKAVPVRPVVAVGIDVLTEQRHLFVSVRERLFKFGKDILTGAAALPAANERHDAVGAKIVAAVHDVDPSVGAARAIVRHILDDRGARIVIYLDVFGMRSERVGNKVAYLFDVARAEHYVYERELFAKRKPCAVLLRHAADDRNHCLGIVFFQLFETTDLPDCLAFGVVANATGVEDYDVGLALGALGNAASLQKPGNFLRFVNVHLTAVCDYPIFRHGYIIAHARAKDNALPRIATNLCCRTQYPYEQKRQNQDKRGNTTVFCNRADGIDSDLGGRDDRLLVSQFG